MDTMCACGKLLVILLIVNVNAEAEKNQTHSKRDTSRIDRPQTKSDDIVKGTYRIVDNEISKSDATIRDSEVETQTSVTLIFLNASYATEVTRVNNVATQKDLEVDSSTEEKSITVQPTSLIEEQSSIQSTERVPETLVNKYYSKATKEPCQKGILDLLFPPERVQIFKSYFNSFKKFLSARF